LPELGDQRRGLRLSDSQAFIGCLTPDVGLDP
jgi:hypothetical protein